MLPAFAWRSSTDLVHAGQRIGVVRRGVFGTAAIFTALFHVRFNALSGGVRFGKPNDLPLSRLKPNTPAIFLVVVDHAPDKFEVAVT